ncbi:hypothetical protein D3C81_1586180 [compost metagenome]
MGFEQHEVPGAELKIRGCCRFRNRRPVFTHQGQVRAKLPWRVFQPERQHRLLQGIHQLKQWPRRLHRGEEQDTGPAPDIQAVEGHPQRLAWWSNRRGRAADRRNLPDRHSSQKHQGQVKVLGR